MSNQYIKGESVLRCYIFKVLLNVIRRKKRGRGKGRGRQKGGEGDRRERGRQKEKRQKKYPRINSRVKVGSSKDYSSLSLLRKSSRLVYSIPS